MTHAQNAAPVIAPPPRARPIGPPFVAAAVFFLVLTVACTWPIARDLRDRVQDAGDPLLEIVVLAWATDATFTSGDGLLEGRQYYPYPSTALYQNSFLGQLPLFAPLYLATGNPVLAFQATLLAALFLSAMCMWGFARSLTDNSWAGLLAGTVFAFHQYRFRNLQHLQIMSIWWWPVALWGLEAFLTARRWAGALVAGLAVAAQFYCSIYMGLMLVALVVLRLFVEAVAAPAAMRERDLWRRGSRTVLITLLLVAPLAVAYLRVARQFPPTHDLDTIVQFSAAPRDYLRVGLSSRPYHWLRTRQPWQYTFDQFVLFAGVVPVVLSVFGLVTAERAQDRTGGLSPSLRRLGFALILAAAVGVVLSLGPYLKQPGRATDVPLPALWLLRYLPGYDVFRVNTRFAFMLLPALSVGVALAYHTVTSRAGLGAAGRIGVLVGALALLFVESWNAPVPSRPVAVGDAVPAEYAALAEHPAGGPVIHVPLGASLYQDIARAYYGLRHRRRLVNGYSTVEPPGYAQWTALAADGPTPALRAALAAWDVRTVVVHYADMSPAHAQQWIAGRTAPDVIVERELPGADIWSLTTVPTLADHPTLSLRPVHARAGQTVAVPLTFTTPEATVWRCPRPLGLRPATVTWQPINAGPLVEEQTRVLTPLFVTWARPEHARLTLHAPARAGEYTLRIDCGVAVAQAKATVSGPPGPTAAAEDA